MVKEIQTKHGKLKLPAFLPDATYGSIRNVGFDDVSSVGVEGVVTTTLHIEQKLGSEYVKKYGGIHKFFGWNKPILTDSGGWQVFSLINSNRANPKNKITEVGCSFVDPESGKYSLLTPESSIAIQSNLESDIMTVLDEPIIGNASFAERKESVILNTKWAKRSKDKFEEIYGKFQTENQDYTKRPMLGAVVQGGDDFELRKKSVNELTDIEFDMYNFGGVPMLSEITWKEEYPEGFHREMLAYVSELLPDDKVKYAMGVGQPEDIAFCIDHGWNLFDTVLPTRNARHGYLYVSEGEGDETRTYKNFSYDVLRLRSKRYEFDEGPIDNNHEHEFSQNISRAYLRHLIRIKEPAGMRIATLHNLAFYSNWINKIRENGV